MTTNKSWKKLKKVPKDWESEKKKGNLGKKLIRSLIAMKILLVNK
jgi:hypothetical protein